MTRWPISRIRSEIERLDQITGLNGRELDIVIGKAKHTLGYFRSLRGKPISFTFSSFYFESDDFSTSEALDTIRHEYAHYMDLMLNGDRSDGSHGNTWKECCRRIGAKPIRCYSKEWNRIMFDREQTAKQKEEQMKQAVKQFAVGTIIKHPAYGEGTILNITEDGMSSHATICFHSVSNKTLAISWMSVHCTVINR